MNQAIKLKLDVSFDDLNDGFVTCRYRPSPDHQHLDKAPKEIGRIARGLFNDGMAEQFSKLMIGCCRAMVTAALPEFNMANCKVYITDARGVKTDADSSQPSATEDDTEQLTVSAKFADLMRMISKHRPMEAVEVMERRRMFYSGAHALAVLMEDASKIKDEARADAQLTALEKEVDDFFLDLGKGS